MEDVIGGSTCSYCQKDEVMVHGCPLSCLPWRWLVGVSENHVIHSSWVCILVQLLPSLRQYEVVDVVEGWMGLVVSS